MSSEYTEGSAESWEIAKNYASLLGTVPASFSSAIRMLLLDRDKNNGALQHTTKAAVRRLFQSPGMVVPLYYAALTIRPEQVEPASTISVKELIELLEPDALAGILATIYLTRRCRKLAPQEEWSQFIKAQDRRIELAFILGDAIVRIGAGKAVLYSALRPIAFATLQIHDLKGANLYLKHLEKERLPRDTKFEVERWGCSVAQVASILVQSVGFGAPFAGAVLNAMGLADGEIMSGLDEETYRLKLLERWSIDLLATGKEPQIVHRGDLYPLKERSQALYTHLTTLKESSVVHGWLHKGKESLTPELAKKLGLSDVEAQAAAGEESLPPDPELTELDQ